MPSVTGRFYFTRTSNGNLLGEYSNNQTKRCWTEGANRNPEATADGSDPFVGEYDTTWYEEDSKESVYARLEIKLKHPSARIYSLTWTEPKSGKVMFEGEAMLCDSLLIGDYRYVGDSHP